VFGEKKKGQNLDKFKILASFRWKVVSSRVKPNKKTTAMEKKVSDGGGRWK